MFQFIKNIFQKPIQEVKSVKTVGEIQNKPLEEWDCGDSEVFDGMRFSVTLQLRTPLDVLIHHNEIYRGEDAPPQYAKEEWHGIWLPYIKPEYSLNIDSEHSSDIGYVDDKEYIKFLIVFRKIVEQSIDTDKKISLLEKAVKEDELFAKYWEKHKFIDADFPYSFFYKQLTKLDGVGIKTAKNLYEHGLKSIKEVQNASEEELLKIQGVGKNTIEKIRKSSQKTHLRMNLHF
ncbi:MAG: hypothetical protein C0627_06660 [Sulfurimonas sp.]|nr:MAG: hypothetical protein C0627_06660 [Sulfurimonas sp.]